MCRVLIKKRLQCTTIRQKQSNCMSGSRKLFGTKLRNTFCRTVTGQNVLPVKTSYLSKVKTSHLSKRPRESKHPTNQNVARPWSKRPMCAWPFKTLLVKMSFRAILLLNRNTAAMWERWRWRWRRNLWSYQCRIAERETKAGRQFWFFIHSQKGILDW